jgi:hypothetical protein
MIERYGIALQDAERNQRPLPITSASMGEAGRGMAYTITGDERYRGSPTKSVVEGVPHNDRSYQPYKPTK